MKLDHIGIAVTDLQAGIAKYEALFQRKPDHLERVEGQKVDVAMFRAGETDIELLQGIDESSPIARFIEKRGEGIHHMCYAVANLEKALADATAAGMEEIKLENNRGVGGSQVAFLHPRTTGGVLIELVQR